MPASTKRFSTPSTDGSSSDENAEDAGASCHENSSCCDRGAAATIRGIASTPPIRRRLRLAALLAGVVAVCSPLGCSLPWNTPIETRPASNPFHLPGRSFEATWETAVDVLHKYGFRIERESRLEYVIETEPKVGSGVLEPWFGDSVGKENRWESSLQSIRRRVFVTVQPHEAGGFLVGVEAIKEKEDVAGQVANSPGLASTQQYRQYQRDLNQVVGQTRPSGWYPIGRDFALEQHLLESLQLALTR